MASLLARWSGSSRIPEEEDEANIPPTKRISTPAGQRLSTIMEIGNNRPTNSQARSSMLSTSAGRRTPLADFYEESASKSSAYTTTTSVWSEGSEKAGGLKSNKHLAKRGGWKRLALLIAVVFVVLLALIVGLVVGLRKQDSSSSSSASESSSSKPTSTTSGSSATAVATPSNFPSGTYSFVTFLDSSYTDCTSNPDTWTCYPYTTYYSSPSSALAIFDWTITKKAGSSNSYQISSSDNPFSVSFTNQDLTLDGAGTDSERYTFRFAADKVVSPSSNLTEDNSAVKCYYNATTFQAYLYTRQVYTYPNDQVSATGASNTLWPARVRVEQVASGGPDTPNCYKIENGKQGARIEGMNGTDSSSLCSCLYKNWVTPT